MQYDNSTNWDHIWTDTGMHDLMIYVATGVPVSHHIASTMGSYGSCAAEPGVLVVLSYFLLFCSAFDNGLVVFFLLIISLHLYVVEEIFF